MITVGKVEAWSDPSLPQFGIRLVLSQGAAWADSGHLFIGEAQGEGLGVF